MRRLLPILCLSLLVFPGVARAGDLHGIEPRIDRRPFETLLVALHADTAQRQVADMLYADYLSGLERLAEDTREAAAAAGRKRVDDALAGRIFLDTEELRRLRLAVAEVEYGRWPEARRRAEELIDNVTSLLGSASDAEIAAALADLHRAMYLHPRRTRENDADYAGDGLDLSILLAQAMGEDGELAGLGSERLAPAMGDYRMRVDSFLLANAEAEHAGRRAMALARIEQNPTARRNAQQDAVGRWRELHEINQSTSRVVTDVAQEELGSDAAARWTERFDRACFPGIFRAPDPERQQAWMVRQDLPEETLRKAGVIVDDFRARHHALCRDAAGLMLKGRLVMGTVIHAGHMDPSVLADPRARDLYQALVRNSGERAELVASATGKLEALLTERQRKKMRGDLRARAARGD